MLAREIWRGGERMRYDHGVWYYQGRAYISLWAALLEAEKNLPAGWRTRREKVSKAYRENVSIIPQKSALCKG